MNRDCCRRHATQVIVLSAVVLEFLAGTLSPLPAAIGQAGCYQREALEPKIQTVIDEFRASVPGIMDKGGVPGAAIALVDDKGIIWTEGFGYTDGKRSPPVTPDTPFMVCGLSKLITATAVMLAVQGIRIDKRAPEQTEMLLWHEGTGFGFSSILHWYPEYGVGVVVLTNKLPHSVLGDLGRNTRFHARGADVV